MYAQLTNYAIIEHFVNAIFKRLDFMLLWNIYLMVYFGKICKCDPQFFVFYILEVER